MSFKDFDHAFKRGYKLTDDLTSATQAMGYYHEKTCKELNEKKKELEEAKESLAEITRKYEIEHASGGELVAKCKQEKSNWKKLNSRYKNAKIEAKIVHHWQLVVAVRRSFTFRALMRWRSSVFKIIIGKQQDGLQSHAVIVNPPSPYIVHMSPVSYANDNLPPIVYSPNTPAHDSHYQCDDVDKLRALCDIVQVDSIEDLEHVLWKVRKLNDDKLEVRKMQRDVVEARMTLNVKQLSLRHAQKNISSHGLGLARADGVEKKRNRPGKSERKINKAQQMLASSLSHGSTSSSFYSPK